MSATAAMLKERAIVAQATKQRVLGSTSSVVTCRRTIQPRSNTLHGTAARR